MADPSGSQDPVLWRRTVAVLLAAAAIGIPAAVLRFLCVGKSCSRPQAVSARVPYCSLPPATRALLTAGFRDGRSPDILAVSGATLIEGSSVPAVRRLGLTWPAIADEDPGEVPLVLSGAGVAEGAEIPAGTGLDAVAPTLAHLIGFKRPHPEVRSGTAIPGIVEAVAPRLIVEFVLIGVGSDDLDNPEGRWPALAKVMDEGAATKKATTGSLPLDPAAVLTTIGTGGIPSQHGITGTMIRNDNGDLVTAWGPRAPVSVIATLSDDYDHATTERSKVGLVAESLADRVLIGGTWYLDADRDDVVTTPDPARGVRNLVQRGYGKDDTTDIIGVTLRGNVAIMDRALADIRSIARRAAGDSLTIVITATGGPAGSPDLHSRQIVERIEGGLDSPRPVVEAAALGGIYLDQESLAGGGITQDEILGTMKAMELSGRRVVADVFPSISVTFARYC